jgi:predicted HTH transcriptional regulator
MATGIHTEQTFEAEAMFNLNMIDTIGSGIKRMFRLQMKRFFPLPEYSIKSSKVSVQIEGEIISKTYTKYLASNPKLSLDQVIILDKVQKKVDLNSEEKKYFDSLQLNLNDQANDQVTDQLTDQVTDQLTDQVTNQVTDQVTKKVITILNYCKIPKSRLEILNLLGISNHSKNYKNHIFPLLEQNWIEYTIKKNPKDRNQKYVTTDKGNSLLND